MGSVAHFTRTGNCANSGERRQIAEAIGLLLAIALSRFLAAQLFQVEAIDPPLYAVATMMLVGVAGLAYGVLAYRAVHVNPAAVLRGDAFPALG